MAQRIDAGGGQNGKPGDPALATGGGFSLRSQLKTRVKARVVSALSWKF